jgi:uncharacterized protein (DUF4415 family)
MVVMVWTPRGDARHIISTRHCLRRKKDSGASEWVDPDDASEITAEITEMMARADFYHGDKLIRRDPGRPPSAAPKQAIKLRLDADVLAHFRETGPGWQTRINETLRRAAKLKKTA